MKKNIILIAPPAAGKGTVSTLLSKEYNLPHISTGSLIREKLKKSNDENLKKIYLSGSLISDDIIINLLNERIKEADCINGYILDGFPRTIEQAKVYNNLNNLIVIYLTVDINEAIKRSLGRVNCPKCGAIYNKINEKYKPKNDNLCDKCNVELVKRPEDTEEILKIRFDSFNKETFPILEYYKNKTQFYEFDSTESATKVFEEIKIIFGELND